MAYCSICREVKDEFTVLHLPRQEDLPQPGQWTMLHTCCTPCSTRLRHHGITRCPFCREPIATPANGVLQVPAYSCSQVFVENTGAEYVPRFCGGRRTRGTNYCTNHEPDQLADEEVFRRADDVQGGQAQPPQQHAANGIISQVGAEAIQVAQAQRQAASDLARFGMEAQVELMALTRYNHDTLQLSRNSLDRLTTMQIDDAQFRQQVERRYNEISGGRRVDPNQTFFNW